MRQKILTISVFVFFIIIGFNNCGDGFQTIQNESLTLDSKPNQDSSDNKTSLYFDLINQPKTITNSLDELIIYQLKNLTHTDVITCRLNNVNLESCLSPLSLTNLIPGPQKLELIINDNKCLNCLHNINWTIDTTPPEINFDSKPEHNSNSDQAMFNFSVSENLESKSCSHNDTSLPHCDSPLIIDSLVAGEHSFNIIMTDLAGNTTVENFKWNVVNLETPIVDDLILNFQMGEDGKGFFKYDEPILQDTTFTVTIQLDAPVKNFLKLLYSETTVPFSKSLDVTIKAGENEKAFSFEELLKPLNDLDRYFPDKVNINIEVYHVNQQKKLNKFTKSIEILGRANAFKSAGGTVWRSYFIRNDNTLYSPPANRGPGFLAKDCNLNFDTHVHGHPILISESGATSTALLTSKNKILTFSSCKHIRTYQLDTNIKVKKIITPFAISRGIYILTDDNKVYMYGINDPKLQLLFNDNIIDIAVPSRNRTLQSIYDIVILKENGVASFYTPSKKQASLELGDKLLGNIIRITATGDYVYFLENTGRIVRFSYPIGSDIGGFQTVSTAISNFDKNKVIDFSSIGDRHYLSYIGAHDSRDAKGNLVLKHLRNYSQIKWVINSRQ